MLGAGILPVSPAPAVPARRAGESGFSLIELAVAGVIAVTLVAAIAGTLRAAIGTGRREQIEQLLEEACRKRATLVKYKIRKKELPS